MNIVAKESATSATVAVPTDSKDISSTLNTVPVAKAQRAGPGTARVTFSTLAAGRPILDRFSARYLRDNRVYLYEDDRGQIHAALASEDQLPLISTIEWTLQQKVIAE